jgi:hypothetical protein
MDWRASSSKPIYQSPNAGSDNPGQTEMHNVDKEGTKKSSIKLEQTTIDNDENDDTNCPGSSRVATLIKSENIILLPGSSYKEADASLNGKATEVMMPVVDLTLQDIDDSEPPLKKQKKGSASIPSLNNNVAADRVMIMKLKTNVLEIVARNYTTQTNVM